MRSCIFEKIKTLQVELQMLHRIEYDSALLRTRSAQSRKFQFPKYRLALLADDNCICKYMMYRKTKQVLQLGQAQSTHFAFLISGSICTAYRERSYCHTNMSISLRVDGNVILYIRENQDITSRITSPTQDWNMSTPFAYEVSSISKISVSEVSSRTFDR